MVSFLIAYGTGEGQTAKIAERIEAGIADRGHEVTVVNVSAPNPDLQVGAFDAIIVGMSIHAGKQQRVIHRFVREHLNTLGERPTALFQVSLSSATEEGQAEAAGYVESFIEKTGWTPERIGLFGGALRYSQYGFLKRIIMQQIAKRQIDEMPAPDRIGDIEFTDWHEVDAFAADTAAFVEGRLGIAPKGQE